MIYRVAALIAFALFVHITAAHSQARNQLRYLEVLNNTRIQSPKGRVNAYSHFDILLQPRSQHHRIKLSLEPNYDVLGDGATVNYIGADGSITRSETIDRAEHKVFKGTTSIENDDDTWTNVGWARISVLRDGVRPLFDGAFSVHHDNHHIQLNSNYMQTKHELDPQLMEEDDNFMVLFRDSDIEQHTHTELKRSVSSDATCLSHQLEFNTRPDHPIYQARLNKDDGQWGSMPLSHVFGKRQFDTQTTGNTAGVNLTQSIGQAQGCPSTRRVALVGVATDCTYTGRFNSTQSTRQNVISVMNAASSAWESTFNISLGLQNLTIMDASCPGSSQAATPWNRDCGANLDISARLNLFSQWRGTLKDNNSHWTLMTSCNTGSAVGLAWLGQVCVNDAFTTNTTGGGSETVSGANVVAYTSTEWQVVAHETGHTFGAVHDCTAGTCGDGTTVKSQQCCPHSTSLCSETDQLYIMNPYTTAGITAFSPCTVGNICSAIGRNSVNTQCLSTNKNIVTISGAQCGNGIVEEGEDCDCGGVAGCSDDPCCNPTTCKFVNGAVCDDANDDCCNQCQFSRNGTLCRASTGNCDPAEYCTGSTGICPRDVLAPDGTHCALGNSSSGGSLACASGQCTSRNMQCQTVMSGYFNSRTANQTFACDDSGCSLSCASPAFGPGACYGLQQNLLDGTPCAGDGKCYNGNCKGATAGGKIRSWIDDHKAVVIGIAAGVGLLLVIILVSCCTSCIRRSKRNNKVVAGSNGQGNRIARQPQQNMNMNMMQQQQGAWPAAQQQWPQQQQPYQQFQPNYHAPPMPPQYSSTQQHSFYAPPPPSSPPANHESVMYGAGIIGSRGAPAPPAYPTTMHGAGANSRYA